jgi:hydrogenase expression/formation protein HypE
VLDPVRAACEMLGLDPLYVANEGVCVAVVAPGDADAILAAARTDPNGRRAAIVGEVTGETAGGGKVTLKTGLGASRPLLMLAGDQLPRIC